LVVGPALRRARLRLPHAGARPSDGGATRRFAAVATPYCPIIGRRWKFSGLGHSLWGDLRQEGSETSHRLLTGCYHDAMRLTLNPFRLLLISLAGCLSQREQDVIDYLQEENRVLRQQLGRRRLRLNDDQRLRLAVRAKKLGWRVLHELTTIVTPSNTLGLAPQARPQKV